MRLTNRKYKIIEVDEDCDHTGYYIEETIYFWKWKLCVRFLADDEDEICPAFPTVLEAYEFVQKLKNKR